MPATLKQLRERWRGAELTALEQQLIDASRKPNTVFPSSPFGNTDSGLTDVRGATLRRPVKYLRVQRADFSGVVFQEGASFIESEVEQCALDGIDMRGVFVGRSFTDCSFARAKLTGTRLGHRFTNCDFAGATLSKSIATGTRFEGCVFTGASLTSVLWTSRCAFDNCIFEGVKSLSGSVAGAVFLGTAPQSLDRCITDHVQLL